jgi:putative membrane-bound dehydrogenase-like protein
MNKTRTRCVLVVLVVLLTPLLGPAQGFAPEEAVKRMTVAEGFHVKLIAAEPVVRQPVTLSFDDRGRLWVIQYLQYPNPVGLKPVEVDQYLRTKYDRLPAPPPLGPRGADRITILEDPDAQGRFRKARDFVGGLNLASGMALGHGGVFVVQPPYLLFYPDRNGDDVPDGDPEVLLTGFGMEDAHAVANSLQWGPDGWLYGAQGSTVTAKIRGIEFCQGIWRYHPITREFELFSEGGGNTWGLDFDRHGNVIAGTNFGGFAMLHQVQGAYYVKNFIKHGALKNAFAFGYFGHVPYTGFRGGHVTCGGIVYQGGSYRRKYHNQYIAANLLSNAIYWHALEPQGSSFKARFGGELLTANDTWFRPVDCLTGPDGSVYIADWYDKRANHVDPVDNWDRSNGRIYKLEAEGTRPVAPFALSRMSSQELVGLLARDNDWFRREARRILAERRDPTVVPGLRRAVLENTGDLALESLWALYVSGGFDDALALKTLGHVNADVRTWTVRLLGDAKKVSSAVRARLLEVARNEASPTVRSQLACSAKRLPAEDCLALVGTLWHHAEDLNDPHIPLLLWWAVEDKALTGRETLLRLFAEPPVWKEPLVRQALVERLARRYMAEGSAVGYAACARLLDMASAAAETDLVVRGMEQALEGRRLPAVPPALAGHLARLWDGRSGNLARLRLALRLGSEPAFEQAVSLVSDARRPDAERSSLVEVLGQLSEPRALPALLGVLQHAKSESLRRATLTALQASPDPRVAETVLTAYPRLAAAGRSQAVTLLASRPASALALLHAVDAKQVAPKDVPLDQVRRMALHKDAALTPLLEKHWGRIQPETTGEKISRVRSIIHMLGQGKGDPARGHLLFQKHCATCHTLFGEGAKIGPDLTSADRKNRQLLVTNIVDPSAVIRPEYGAYVVETKDGQALTGLLADAGPQAVTLVDARAERTVIARDRIASLTPSPVSLMPEKILDPLDDQEIRDFFSFLQGDGPAAPAAPEGDKARAKKRAAPLKVCLVSGSLEYQSDESLAKLQQYLESHYNVQCSRAFRKADNDLPGLENLETCDVMVLFTRRLTISGEQLERVKKYCQSGKPIVALRTASHAFQNWLALDKEVLGGNYKNHYKDGPVMQVSIVEKNKDHPVLKGVKPFRSVGSLYKNTGLAADNTVLLMGTIPDHTEPIAWTRTHNGGRVFYTSLGHPRDFDEPDFVRLLVNALFWTTQREPAPTGEAQGKGAK